MSDSTNDYLPQWMTVSHGLDIVERLLRLIEFVAALVLVLLFGIGVFDLILRLYERTVSGVITDPSAVIGLIDTVLLLFIIVELYKTVVAYAEESGMNKIVTIVLYTTIIAVARKFIIFRTGEYASVTDALMAAGAYGIIALGLGILLFAFQHYTIDKQPNDTQEENEEEQEE